MVVGRKRDVSEFCTGATKRDVAVEIKCIVAWIYGRKKSLAKVRK